jgi:hypothetical protein
MFYSHFVDWVLSHFTPPQSIFAHPDLEYAETLTKGDLKEYANEFGIQLNPRKTKMKMIEEFRDSI